jgi:hypothetical protein
MADSALYGCSAAAGQGLDPAISSARPKAVVCSGSPKSGHPFSFDANLRKAPIAVVVLRVGEARKRTIG